jgi:hypothetical protein
MGNCFDLIVLAANLCVSLFEITGSRDETAFCETLKNVIVIVPDFAPKEGVKNIANNAEAKEQELASAPVEMDVDTEVGQILELESLPAKAKAEIVDFKLTPIEFDKDSYRRSNAVCHSIIELSRHELLHPNRGYSSFSCHRWPHYPCHCHDECPRYRPHLPGTVQDCRSGSPESQEWLLQTCHPLHDSFRAPASCDNQGSPQLKWEEWNWWSAWDSLDIMYGQGRPDPPRASGLFLVGVQARDLHCMLSYGVSIILSFFANPKPKKVAERKKMKMSKRELPSDQLFLGLEVIATDMESDEDVELPHPYSYFKLRIR